MKLAVLHCCKSGREWPAATYGIAHRIALHYGLKDWEWKQ